MGRWILLLLSSRECLAVGQDEPAAPVPASPLDAAQLVDTGIGLVIVLALIVALAWVARRFGRAPLRNGSQVQVLGGVSLGPRERAVLIECDGARVLVGVAPGQVRTLHVARAEGVRSTPYEEVVQQVSEAAGR